MACGHAFYTIAPYDGSPCEHSPLPFKDRPLTEMEEIERLEWWQEVVPVTREGNNTNDAAFLNRIAMVILNPEGERTTVDKYIADVFAALKQRVAAMEAPPKHEGEE